MIKVLFVDDEVLAMEYLQNLISWEEYGFQVVGHAQNGKRALEMYEKEKPELVISDISMSGMDGLELTKRLKEQNDEVIVILLSAYKDFEYAKHGIEYGVSNYLLKHELDEDKLVQELNKVRQKLEDGGRKRKIYQKYFARQLIYNSVEDFEIEEKELGNRFFLILVHKNNSFIKGTFQERSWSKEELIELFKVTEVSDGEISYVSDVRLTLDNLIVLYRIKNINSKYEINSRIERLSRNMGAFLSLLPDCQFNLIYSEEIQKYEISHTFQRMSGQIRYAVFWRPCCIYGLSRLMGIKEEEKISWNEQEEELKKLLYEGRQDPADLLCYLFEMVKYPVHNVRALRELLYMLESLLSEIEKKEGISLRQEEESGNKLEDIQKYYTKWFHHIYEEMRNRENKKYSNMVQDMTRYIRQNYDQELSLEIIGDKFQMNGVYLGQMFKKEMGITFLKYLTNCRIEAAKHLLVEGRLNIYEISEKVGYRTSQYFSQIFIKTVGVKPQEYRKWNKKR